MLEEIFERSDYLLDVGYIAPYYLKTDNYEILPFEKIKKGLRVLLLEYLNDIFKPIEYNEQYIRYNWKSLDIFYVLTTPKQENLIGCIAVDIKNGFPLISNLLIIPKYRKQNYANILLEYCFNYIKILKFREVRLWCNDELIDFYIKKNWKFEKKIDNNNIMLYIV